MKEKKRLTNNDALHIQLDLMKLYKKGIPIDRIITELLDLLVPNYNFTYAASSYVVLDIQNKFLMPINVIAHTKTPQEATPDSITKILNLKKYFSELSLRCKDDLGKYLNCLYRETNSSLYNYKGIPDELHKRIFWINNKKFIDPQKKRYNSSDFNIVVERTDGRIIGYNGIKKPIKYMGAFERRVTNNNEDLIAILKKNITRVFLKRNTYYSAYNEVWNNSMNCNIEEAILIYEKGLTEYDYSDYPEKESNDYQIDSKELEIDTFYALTDGQYGSYEELHPQEYDD